MSRSWLLAALITASLPLTLLAQEEGAPPSGDRPGPPDQPPPGEMRHGDRPGGPEMVERWLEHVKEKNPQEYERLVKLRKDDPEAFRKELDARLRKEQARAFLNQHPQMREAIMSLSEQDRDVLMDRIAQGPPPRGPGMHQGPDGSDFQRNPDIDAAQQAMHKLAESYKAAATPDEKTKIKADLKDSLGQLFDLREKQRATDIAQFEQHLQEFKTKLETRKANRDQIIQKKLDEITGGDEMAW